MSFMQLTKDKLLKTADDDFAVAVDENWSKKEIVEALEASGVTWESYVQIHEGDAGRDPADLDAKPEAPVETTVIKMSRKNESYHILGYRFTKNNPFVAVNKEHVDEILELEGFNVAKPRDVQAFYS